MSVKSSRSTKNASRSRQAGRPRRTGPAGRFPDRAAVSGKGSAQSHMQYYRSHAAIRMAPVPYRTGRRV